MTPLELATATPVKLFGGAGLQTDGGNTGPPVFSPAGDDHFQAPAIVEKNSKTYLLATPVDTTTGNRYNGCRGYEFIDVDTNQLHRNTGDLAEVARIDGDVGTHNGACDDYAGLAGGLLLSQFEPGSTPETFKIYKSRVNRSGRFDRQGIEPGWNKRIF